MRCGHWQLINDSDQFDGKPELAPFNLKGDIAAHSFNPTFYALESTRPLPWSFSRVQSIY